MLKSRDIKITNFCATIRKNFFIFFVIAQKNLA